ncbi:hypothetical protein HKD37_07G017838 [Glycine soja]|nr:hypothetical protein GmHk_07G018132 [Glycine max]
MAFLPLRHGQIRYMLILKNIIQTSPPVHLYSHQSNTTNPIPEARFQCHSPNSGPLRSNT